MREFRYARSMTRAGYTWYCQSPGVNWRTDPIIGWQLYYTDGPSWWLMGTGEETLGYEIDMCTRQLKVAMDEAAREIEKIKNGGPV